MSECYHRRCREENQDGGFMGYTHALSGVAAFLAIMAWAPAAIISGLGITATTTGAAVLILVCITIDSGSLSPDLDNTRSTSQSSLGIFGNLLSALFRTTSVIIQTTIRSKYDSADANPHRGFYHTPLSAAILGALISFACNFNGSSVTMPILGSVSTGRLFAFVFCWASLHMALTGLFGSFMRKLKKSKVEILGEVFAAGFSGIVTLMLFSQLPATMNLWWIGASFAVGMLVHILGDTLTTAGTPLFFPIPIRGKMWWNVRLLPIKAGGVIENMIFVPTFMFVIVVSIIRLVTSMW